MMGGLAHQGGFVKARQNQLQFSRIAIDIANRKDTRLRGRKFFRIHRYAVLVEIEPPIGNRPKFHCQAEKR